MVTAGTARLSPRSVKINIDDVASATSASALRKPCSHKACLYCQRVRCVEKRLSLGYHVRMKSRRLLPTFTLSLVAALLAVFCTTSCERSIGYSVVLWTLDEQGVADGTLVKVLLKSNISKVYVITHPITQLKVEVPLWKLSEPSSKAKALELAAKHSSYKGKYALCALDGLPMRSEKVNTSAQVYRLRKGETVRVLYESEGVIPTNGGVPLEGVWLRVLTEGGVQGWCFSYNLRLFDMASDGTRIGQATGEEAAQGEDEVLRKILEGKWYPDYYKTMAAKKQVDLDYVVTGWGFDSGYTSGVTKVSVAGLDESFEYSPFSKTQEASYKAEDAPVEVFWRGEGKIAVKVQDKAGKVFTRSFVELEESPEQIIAAEKERRRSSYKAIQSLGPDFRSAAFGTLSFYDGFSFSWSGFSALTPAVIPKGAGEHGTVQLKYFLEGSLASSWQGVITFVFEGSTKEVSFLYKREAMGLRLALANVTVRTDEASSRRVHTVSLPANSIVIFFQK